MHIKYSFQNFKYSMSLLLRMFVLETVAHKNINISTRGSSDSITKKAGECPRGRRAVLCNDRQLVTVYNLVRKPNH